MQMRQRSGAGTEVLGPLERRVMERLWHDGSATVGEIRDALATTGHDVAYTTVLTILARLYEKAYVTRIKEGRQFRYAAAFDASELPAEAGRRELRRLIDRHGAASLAGFARDLVDADSDLVLALRELGDRETKANP